jgi:hypothetical protein
MIFLQNVKTQEKSLTILGDILDLEIVIVEAKLRK